MDEAYAEVGAVLTELVAARQARVSEAELRACAEESDKQEGIRASLFEHLMPLAAGEGTLKVTFERDKLVVRTTVPLRDVGEYMPQVWLGYPVKLRKLYPEPKGSS